ncbi:MAG: hypothetical protein WC878_00805 [Candidatus Paceibacterota bacterium]|jgi:hypothetical protein
MSENRPQVFSSEKYKMKFLRPPYFFGILFGRLARTLNGNPSLQDAPEPEENLSGTGTKDEPIVTDDKGYPLYPKEGGY